MPFVIRNQVGQEVRVGNGLIKFVERGRGKVWAQRHHVSAHLRQHPRFYETIGKDCEVVELEMTDKYYTNVGLWLYDLDKQREAKGQRPINRR